MRNDGGQRRRVSATEAAKNFGGIVDRVREDRTIYLVERAGTPVAEIRPTTGRPATVADLVALLRDRPHPLDRAFGRAVEDGVKTLNRRERPRDPWGS
jgi:antitoxin (DNA-binding transcriptional repressor) of toxin-antitoxin stability system